MRTIEEIIASVKDYRYTSASGPVLDVCRELAQDGRFSDIASVLRDWVQVAPQSEMFVRASLPAIILNSYLALKDILTFEKFMEWTRVTPTWADQIAGQALHETGLQKTVDGILDSMTKFAK